MTIHPTGLSPEDQQVLSELAAKSQDEALRQAVNSYLERTAQPSQSNGSLDSEHEREQAFLRAAGAWHDMDTDTLIEETAIPGLICSGSRGLLRNNVLALLKP